MSFETESQHLVLSFEVLEHIPNYQLAVKEAHRILRNGGALILTAPFVEANVKNIQRAIVTDKGNIVQFEEPEYHGDPVSSDGILCFYHFGWELLDDFRAAGFADVRLLTMYSDLFANYGKQLYLHANDTFHTGI